MPLAIHAAWKRLVFATALAGCLAMIGANPETAQAQNIQIAQSDAADIEFWQSVKDSADPEELAAYLSTWPNGKFAALARIRLKKLRAKNTVVAPPPKTVKPAAVSKTDYPASDTAALGVELTNVTRQFSELHNWTDLMGARIVRVFPNSSGARAGLEADDMIVRMNGRSVINMQQMISEIKKFRPGDNIDLAIRRRGVQISKTARLGGQPTDMIAAADTGEPFSLVQLGIFYEYGISVAIDPVKARELFKQAADKGNVAGRFRLGMSYYIEANKTKEAAIYRKALVQFESAGDENHMPAKALIAYLHELGLAGDKNPRLAMEYYGEAAKGGNPMALNNLATMYSNGTAPARKNKSKAIGFYRQAALEGNALAIKNLKSIKVTPFPTKTIQRLLSDHGLYTGGLDGKMGPGTRAAIRAFEKMIGLEPTGKVSDLLIVRMHRSLKRTDGPEKPSERKSGIKKPIDDLPDLEVLEDLD